MIEFEDSIICLDCPEELAHALAVASREAKQTGYIRYVYSNNLFFCLGNRKSHVPRKDVVAMCYPGGRTILYRGQA